MKSCSAFKKAECQENTHCIWDKRCKAASKEVDLHKATRQFADLVNKKSIELNEEWADEIYKYMLKRSARGIANITIEPILSSEPAEPAVSPAKEFDAKRFVGAILKELEHIQEVAQRFEKLGILKSMYEIGLKFSWGKLNVDISLGNGGPRKLKVRSWFVDVYYDKNTLIEKEYPEKTPLNKVIQSLINNDILLAFQAAQKAKKGKPYLQVMLNILQFFSNNGVSKPEIRQLVIAEKFGQLFLDVGVPDLRVSVHCPGHSIHPRK